MDQTAGMPDRESCTALVVNQSGPVVTKQAIAADFDLLRSNNRWHIKQSPAGVCYARKKVAYLLLILAA